MTSLKKPLVTVGYEYRDKTDDAFSVRGSAASDGVVGATYERHLGSGDRLSFVCAVSTLYNLSNDKFEIGFGLTAILNDH